MERDERGRFVPGNPGGPGRPPRQVERAYLDALLGAVSLEDWADIIRRAVQNAKLGDAQARAWLSKYLLGDGPVFGRLEQLDAQEETEQLIGLLRLRPRDS